MAETSEQTPNSQLTALSPIKLIDAESGAYLCEWIPSAGLVKLRHRDKLFIVDLERLTALHVKGFRTVKSRAISVDQPLIEEPR